MKTLYDLLGIDPSATQAQIEQGYRQRLDHYLASQQGAGKPDEETRRIQMAREAYLLLCSPKRRQAYDQQLRLYQKARAQMSSRTNRKLLVCLMVVAIAIVAGVYAQRVWQLGARAHAQRMQEQQAMRTAVTVADRQLEQVDPKAPQVLASGR